MAQWLENIIETQVPAVSPPLGLAMAMAEVTLAVSTTLITTQAHLVTLGVTTTLLFLTMSLPHLHFIKYQVSNSNMWYLLEKPGTTAILVIMVEPIKQLHITIDHPQDLFQVLIIVIVTVQMEAKHSVEVQGVLNRKERTSVKIPKTEALATPGDEELGSVARAEPLQD